MPRDQHAEQGSVGQLSASLQRTQVVAVGAHSFSNHQQVKVEHIDLDLEVLFDQRIIRGTALLEISNRSERSAAPLILDTMDLAIESVAVSSGGTHYRPTAFDVGPRDPILGAPLTIDLASSSRCVRIEYATSPTAAALQWLEPRQTAGGSQPFLYTQSQSIYARSWIPLQDSPIARVTYAATVRTPSGVVALMSADNNGEPLTRGAYRFKMGHRIPSYLIALAVGDIQFTPIGKRTGVFAERPHLTAAANEFDDVERMMTVAEKLYGPYRWGRYDILVLPPSFPFGGMENPQLSFITPTVLAGDKSLISLVAHELAHSWSGNLVTNATWRDFWLNEGFTVYVERRILEEVIGSRLADMEAALGILELKREMADLDERDEIMHVDLDDRDPDEGFTEVPYEKGALFLKYLENTFGRARFDAFLRRYFDDFAFRSITTTEFVAYLKSHLLDEEAGLAKQIQVEEWLYEPGVPPNAPRLRSSALEDVERKAKQWVTGGISADDIKSARWTTQEWLHFLRRLPERLDREEMQKLDEVCQLTNSANAEVACQWLILTIRNSYEQSYCRLEEFITSIGRIKFLKPLYQELVKTTEGKRRALSIFGRARAAYHPIAIAAIEQVLGLRTENP